jgi:hypothetical protein
MIIFFETYPWVNESTGQEPVTGDEFKYIFFAHKDRPRKKFLCMNPAKHPIKQHPIGFLGILSFFIIIILYFFGVPMFDFNAATFDLLDNYGFILLFFVVISFISGTMFSFGFYIDYYIKERKWKQQVINDWKSNKLRYKYSKSTLGKFGKWGEPQDEELFF